MFIQKTDIPYNDSFPDVWSNSKYIFDHLINRNQSIPINKIFHATSLRSVWDVIFPKSPCFSKYFHHVIQII